MNRRLWTTEKSFDDFEDMDHLDSSRPYRRAVQNRVFVNRNVYLDNIQFFGFDMDYTLAVYRSPDYEIMTLELAVERLISQGYPPGLRNIQYDSTFPTRGLVFDSLYGNFLKIDTFGNILVVFHGFENVPSPLIVKMYPNKFIQVENDGRYDIMNTLFHLPEIFLLAYIINFFESDTEWTHTQTAVENGKVCISFRSMYQDVRAAVDWIHNLGDLKKKTIEQISRYVIRDERLPLLCQKMHDARKKVFVITNSGFEYTNIIMTYLFDIPGFSLADTGRPWYSYFDVVVVSARKPLFFGEGTALRKVDPETGTVSIGRFKGPLEPGSVFVGGNSEVFSDLVGASGKDILYIGDHIFGDILKSKKQQGWRTYLVIPELTTELMVWTEEQERFNKLKVFEVHLAEIYKNLDASCNIKPDISNLRTAMKDVVESLELCYGKAGSLFRCGSRQTFFASQVMRYADLYAANCVNLINYPFSYLFRAPPQLMPHESTVEHDRSQLGRPPVAANTWGRSMSIADTSYQHLDICADEDLEDVPAAGSSKADQT